jgi:hypothetical protein
MSRASIIRELLENAQQGAHPSDPAQPYGVFELEMTDWELDQAIQDATKMVDARDSTRRHRRYSISSPPSRALRGGRKNRRTRTL